MSGCCLPRRLVTPKSNVGGSLWDNRTKAGSGGRRGDRKNYSGRRIAGDLLFCRKRFPATNDLRQAAQRTVYCFTIRKHFCNVGLQYDDVASPRVTPRVFSTDALRKIILA